MKRALSCTLTLLAATLAVAPARANDTMADLKAGGTLVIRPPAAKRSTTPGGRQGRVGART